MFKRRKKAQPVHSLEELQEMADTGKPILVDFFQYSCAPCQVMEGIVNEIADDFDGSAHVVKINVQQAPWAVQKFKIRSTPTFLVLSSPQQGGAKAGVLQQRWRGQGTQKKTALADLLVKAGADQPST